MTDLYARILAHLDFEMDRVVYGLHASAEVIKLVDTYQDTVRTVLNEAATRSELDSNVIREAIADELGVPHD